MTKKEFEKYFRANVLPVIREVYETDGRGIDYPARREGWNNVIDAWRRDGLLPPRARNWTCPW